MASVHSIDSSKSGQTAQTFISEQSSKSGSSGTRKVSPHPEPSQTIPRQESRQGRPEDTLEGAQPSEGKQVVGGSPEEQLGRLIANDDLAECYKLRAKDLYFDASLSALGSLQNFVANVDPGRDPVSMAKDFNKSLKAVQSSLKNMSGGNASDLNITINTPEHGSVQLIPFNLKKIEPGQLAELLDIAQKLTENAVKEWRDNPSYPALREKYSQSIAQHSPQIGNLLASIHPDNKEAFTRQVDLLQSPKVQIQFGDGPSMTIDNEDEREPLPMPVTPPEDDAALKKRVMDEAVEHYRNQGIEDPRGYVEKHKELVKELEQLQRINMVPAAKPANGSEDPLTQLDLPADGTALFRGIFALAYKDERWVNASKADLVAKVGSDEVVLSIKFAIDQTISEYLTSKPETGGQRIVAKKLQELVTSDDFKSKVYDAAFAHGEFSHGSVGDLANLLDIDLELLADDEKKSCRVELKKLVNLLYKGLLAEFSVPESHGNDLGLRWQLGRYSLMVDSSSFKASS